MMSDSLGPVSAVLEADLRDWVARHSLIIWLDADSHYSDFVARLIELRQHEELKYDVFTFRGSHLELLLELEHVTGGIDTTRAVIHLPGFNEDLVKSTPLFELYRAGRRYRKALDTLIRDAAAGRVRPDKIDEFLRSLGGDGEESSFAPRKSRVFRGAKGDNLLSLADADLWLNDLLTTGAVGLASQLRKVSLIELVDDLLLNRSLARRIADIDFRPDEPDLPTASEPSDHLAVRDRIVALTGMPESWFDESLSTSYSSGQQQTSAEAVAYPGTKLDRYARQLLCPSSRRQYYRGTLPIDRQRIEVRSVLAERFVVGSGSNSPSRIPSQQVSATDAALD